MQVDPQFLDSDSDCETDVSQPLSKHHCDHDTLGQARQQAAFGKREREEPEPCSCPEEHVVSSAPMQPCSPHSYHADTHAHTLACSAVCSAPKQSQCRSIRQSLHIAVYLQREKKPRRHRKRLHDLSDVSSVGITARGQLDEYRFNMFMRDLLTEKAKDIFRCKGVLSVHVSVCVMHAAVECQVLH